MVNKMDIEIEDIIKKYETNIKTENMSKKLRETIIISDENLPNAWFVDENTSLDEIKKAEHEKDNEYEIYTYKFKDYEINISYIPSDYRSMNIYINKETPEYENNPVTTFQFDYKGEQWGVKY